MRRRLVVPAALAVTVITGVAVAVTSCGDEYKPQCRLFCIPDDPPPPSDGGVADADAGPPVECPECSDENGQCPIGCTAVG